MLALIILAVVAAVFGLIVFFCIDWSAPSGRRGRGGGDGGSGCGSGCGSDAGSSCGSGCGGGD